MKDEERLPLRIVLRNFLNHIENLESQISSEKSYDIEFQALKLFSESVKGLKDYSCLEGEKEINRKKNRYKDILPFDVSRVVLQEHNGIPGSDYINANYIKGASGSPAYIASQGPLPCTVNDFWRMVVQCEVHVIVMACNQEEAGKAKCEKYWVDEGEERHFGKISVRLLKSSTVCPDFSVRTMRLKYSNTTSMVAEERTVCQVHYVAWPDHGVPSVVHPLLDMVRLVRDTQASETLPVLVHCSAGCGRTGTICAIDYVFGLLRTGKLTSDFSLSSLIRDMRRQRIAMVQTKEQYVLVHQAVRELFREQLSVIDSHPYENVDPDGTLLIKLDQDNIYDTIDCTESKEKGDLNKEKDANVPPHSSKKNVTLYSSKQEKEVENLTEQLRSVQAGPKQGALPTSQQPQLVFSHHQARSSHKQEFSRRRDNISATNKPIPSKGILRVPLLQGSGGNAPTAGPSNIVPIKRSKSLKVMPSHKEKGLGPMIGMPSEIHKTSYQAHLHPSLAISSPTVQRSDLETSKHHSNTNAVALSNEAPVTKKLDTVNSSEKRLIRSYTTLDMRHKPKVSSSECQPLNLTETRSAMNFSKISTNKVNAAEVRYMHQAINSKKGNSTPQAFRYMRPLPSSEPPVRTYLVREKGSKNVVSKRNAHYSGSPGTTIHQQTIRNFGVADLKYPFHPVNHHRNLIHKSIPGAYGFSADKPKKNRDLMESTETSVDSPDKFNSAGIEKPQQHVYAHHKPIHSSLVGQNVSLYPPLPPRNQFLLVPSVSRDVQVESSNFATAPGVDIDQVAASIPHKDGSKSNLMKVTLEAFQAKKNKQHSRGYENAAANKGSSPNYPLNKKKQQQYL